MPREVDAVARCYTMLDVRLGLVELTEDQRKVIRTKVIPVLARAARRELAKWQQAQQVESAAANE